MTLSELQETKATNPQGWSKPDPISLEVDPARLEEMRQANYSAWNRHAAWYNFSDHVAGNPHFHFILGEDQMLYRLYLLPSDAKPDSPLSKLWQPPWPWPSPPVYEPVNYAIPIPNLPIKPTAIFWGEGYLWMAEDSESLFDATLYSLDPITFACKAEAGKFPRATLNPRYNDYSPFNDYWAYTPPYITASYIFYGSADYVWCHDRSTNPDEYKEIYDGVNHIRSIGPDRVWITVEDGGIFRSVRTGNLIVYADGTVVPLHEYPEIAPLLPIMQDVLSHSGGTEDLLNHICFIDFYEEKLYFATNEPNFDNDVLNVGRSSRERCCSWQEQKIYELPFRSSTRDDVQPFFFAPGLDSEVSFPYLFDGERFLADINGEWNFFRNEISAFSDCLSSFDFSDRSLWPEDLRRVMEEPVHTTRHFKLGKTDYPIYEEWGSRVCGLLGDDLYLWQGRDLYRHRYIGGSSFPSLAVPPTPKPGHLWDEKIEFLDGAQ